VNKLLEKHSRSREALLAILHDVQDAARGHYVSDDALREVAEYVGIPLSDVVSTATFYSMYSRRPRGRHIVRMCESPPCRLAGGTDMLTALTKQLGVKVGETTKDGAFTLETTSCLGLCAEAPAMMVDDRTVGGLTPEKVASVIAEVRRSDAAK
jgi:NADH-quinone oxidoreductase subunit E